VAFRTRRQAVAGDPLPALDEPLGWVIPETGDRRAAPGYLRGDHRNFIAGLEAVSREPEVDHVGWSDQLAGPIHDLAVIALHVDLQEDMGIDPTPFHHGALQCDHFVVVRRVAVMCDERNRKHQQGGKRHENLDSPPDSSSHNTPMPSRLTHRWGSP
jgi:hypothetical protein